MNKQSKGWGTYAILIVVLIVLFIYLPNVMSQSKTISNTEYQTLLETGKLTKVVIDQNGEVPTGVVRFETQDGESGKVNVPDVKEAAQELKDRDVAYSMNNVSKDSIFLTLILPVMLCSVVVIIFMSLMNRSAGGGGTNAKMMNFGKSRARMSTDQDKKVMFSDRCV